MIRLWEKYGADAENNGAFRCIEDMAEIDPDLALAVVGRAGPSVRRRGPPGRRPEKLAETDAAGALALLNQKPDSESQSVLQALADRFAETRPQEGHAVRRGGGGAGRAG